METQTTLLLNTEVAVKKAIATCTFSEIIEADELEQVFRLRYEMNAEPGDTVSLKPGNSKIDIDAYDLHSRHYGIIAGDREMVAIIRVLQDKTGYCNHNVADIAGKFHVLNEPMNAYQEFILAEIGDYPFHTYSTASKKPKSHYLQLLSKNSGFAEAVILVNKDEYSMTGLSSFLMDCVMAIFNPSCSGKMYAVLCSDGHHRLFSEKYGLRPFGDTHYYTCDSAGKLSMYLCPCVLPEHLAMKFRGISAEYLITGKTTGTI